MADAIICAMALVVSFLLGYSSGFDRCRKWMAGRFRRGGDR